MAAKRLKIWYDPEGDYLEVIFDQKPGYFRETASDQVMEKVDDAGNIDRRMQPATNDNGVIRNEQFEVAHIRVRHKEEDDKVGDRLRQCDRRRRNKFGRSGMPVIRFLARLSPTLKKPFVGSKPNSIFDLLPLFTQRVELLNLNYRLRTH